MKRIIFFIGFHSMILVQAIDSPFAECLPDDPTQALDKDALSCIFQMARKTDLWQEGAQFIRDYEPKQLDNPWVPYYLGHFERTYDPQLAVISFELAATEFRKKGMYQEVFRALDRKGRALEVLGQDAEFAAVNNTLDTLEEESDEPMLSAHIFNRKARVLLEEGRELGLVLELLAKAESIAFPDGPAALQISIRNEQYSVAWSLGLAGLVHRALTHYTELVEEHGSNYQRALAQYRWAIVAVLEIPTEESQQAALEKAELAYQFAQEIDNMYLKGLIAPILGKLTRGESRRAYFQEAMVMAKGVGNYSMASTAGALLATALAEVDPEQASRFFDQMFLDNQRIENVHNGVFGWEARMAANWSMLDPTEALESSLHDLALIETLRNFQSEELTQIRLFEIWSRAFLWLSGRLLLENQEDPFLEYLAQAFHLVEQVRARKLLENIDDASKDQIGKTNEPLEEVLNHQARNYWQLAAFQLAPEDQATKLAELDVLAQQAQALRQNNGNGNLKSREELVFAELEDVQAALEADEAMLAFQIQPWKNFYDDFGGGAWLMAVTRDEVRAYPLHETYQLMAQLELFLGLFESGGSFEQVQKISTIVCQNLLGEALANLPAEVERLWLIPDNILHKTPFAVLRPELNAPAIGETYQLTTIPSATLWLKWRNDSVPTTSSSALSLSDPSLPNSPLSAISSSLRGQAPSELRALGRLPFARTEGKSLIRNMGGASKLLMGEEASEAFIKTADLKQYGLLHFAAHALAGEELKQDSAVVLAPGNGEDGWLRPNEILNLQLDGQVVVLSACQSASGAIYQGEGVMSLARAFFQAGAHVVVGSLWKLRDDDAAHLFEAFYRHLGKGLSVSRAMREAQQERIRAGAPVAAWSGVTVLGNGDLVPMPNGRSLQPGWQPLLWIGFFVSLILGLWLAWRHRQRKPLEWANVPNH